MLLRALFDPFSVAVLLAVLAMLATSGKWTYDARRAFDRMIGGLGVLRRIAGELLADHPIRKRLESAPVVDLSFEEIARLLEGDAAHVDSDAHVLVRLRERITWIERFAQFAVHLGILGTVYALVSSDPSDLDAFRAGLPTALGTTFWGLVGALGLSAVAGAAESVLERASLQVRQALLAGLDRRASTQASPEAASP
ncbi:MotA/TolQ/ExbB proton channel family protein [Nannocystaceae bacterium ST9]